MGKDSLPTSQSNSQSGGIQVELREKRASGCGNMSLTLEKPVTMRLESQRRLFDNKASEMERTKVEKTRKLCALVVNIY